MRNIAIFTAITLSLTSLLNGSHASKLSSFLSTAVPVVASTTTVTNDSGYAPMSSFKLSGNSIILFVYKNDEKGYYVSTNGLRAVTKDFIGIIGVGAETVASLQEFVDDTTPYGLSIVKGPLSTLSDKGIIISTTCMDRSKDRKNMYTSAAEIVAGNNCGNLSTINGTYETIEDNEKVTHTTYDETSDYGIDTKGDADTEYVLGAEVSTDNNGNAVITTIITGNHGSYNYKATYVFDGQI